MAFTRSIGLSMIRADMFEEGGFLTRISLRNEKKDRSRIWWNAAVEDGWMRMTCAYPAGLGLGSPCVAGGHGPCAARRPLVDSRPASEEGSCMDPARLPHAPHPLAHDSQTTCRKTQ